MIAGTRAPVYNFDHGVLADSDVALGEREMRVGEHRISLALSSPYEDMKLR